MWHTQMPHICANRARKYACMHAYAHARRNEGKTKAKFAEIRRDSPRFANFSPLLPAPTSGEYLWASRCAGKSRRPRRPRGEKPNFFFIQFPTKNQPKIKKKENQETTKKKKTKKKVEKIGRQCLSWREISWWYFFFPALFGVFVPLVFILSLF